MADVQIFGLKNSHATRAAERFFKERRATIHFVNLGERPMAPAEIRRFIERFGLAELVDRKGKHWIDAGLAYMSFQIPNSLPKSNSSPICSGCLLYPPGID